MIATLSALGVMLAGALPKILMNMLGMIVTEKFLADLIEDGVIYLLRKGAKLTATNYDDEKVEQITAMLKEENSNHA